MIEEMRKEITRIAYDVAGEEGVAVVVCQLGADYDAFKVMFRADGVRGPMFGVRYLDAKLPTDDDAFNELIWRELSATAKGCKSAAAIPREIPLVDLGGGCPDHPENQVRALDFGDWTVSCGEDLRHALPDKIAYGRTVYGVVAKGLGPYR